MATRAVTRGELVSAVCAVLLLVLMLAVAWYGVDEIPGQAGSRRSSTVAETGWDGLTGIRWLVLLTVLVALAAVAAHAVPTTRQTIAAIRLAVLVLSSATVAALIFRVLIDLPSSDRVVDQKLGAVLGMLVSLGIVFGAAAAVREQRARLAASQ